MINHLGIIMDGNRRWAKQKLLPSIMGHKAGYKNAQKIIKSCSIKGIKNLTIWALSKENLIKRETEELSGIIKIINSLKNMIGELNELNIKFETIGDIEKLPDNSQKILSMIKDKTINNNGMTLIVALVYSGKDEIIRGIKKLLSKGINIDDINETSFGSLLDTNFLPTPDLIIRTGGDVRHSGFLLYNCDYSEYFFSKKYWPDFDEKELDLAIESFLKTKRNFGK